MEKNVKVFDYEGNVGVQMNVDAKYINDPIAPGQLGTVISSDDIAITKGAKDIIRKATRTGGSFSSTMLTNHGDGKGSIGIMGFGNVHLGNKIEIGRDCSLSVLDMCTEIEMEAPEDYRAYVDSLV